jgi:hypothetical protein
MCQRIRCNDGKWGDGEGAPNEDQTNEPNKIEKVGLLRSEKEEEAIKKGEIDGQTN